MRRQFTEGGHSFQSFDRFEGADEYTACMSIGFAGNIQTVVHAIDEVDIRDARRSEEDGVSCRSSDVGVSCRIVGPEIRLYFDNAACQPLAIPFANQKL